MTRLGDFLEAVYSPAERFNSVRASLRQWCNRTAADNAQGGGRTAMGRRKLTPESPARIEETDLSVWLTSARQVRIEKKRRRGGQIEESLTVVNGDDWWRRDHEGHVETPGQGRRSSPGLSHAEWHFDRAHLRQIFVALSLEGAGTIRVADHDCIRVRAIPLPGGLLWPHWLPYGADEYEFHAEAQRGVLLSIIARTAGQVFDVSEVTRVAFDEPLDPAHFIYEPRPGEQVRPADPITESLTLAAAVARMPFVVLVPTRLPDPDHSRTDVMYHPPRLRARRTHLTIGFRRSEQFERLWIKQAATVDPELKRMEWERVELAGRSMRISEPDEPGLRVVSLEQAGTHVTIWSDLDRERLLDLAASLEPATRPVVEG